ncbi:BZ3500_MvSof-1268-A1-R1_Chr1-3g02478 [Microbotryum saponariae]|uniref:rRNA-processing protein EFG1 n=1 Tax=Microbotryum saponariae TaxID=289078 RepID=A0A2X0MHH1_9BASI|nr:BZ3500_MvSof-1268-A1-R1_Chr1-3g02478 [Microbotryum saponariae]SCZ96344.1 BZ3501_MvSof-1269-A2-R1_Chr1-3g02081 [Microbotryum saponariae]
MSCHIHPDRQAGPSSWSSKGGGGSSNEASTSSTRGGKGGRGRRLGGNRVRVGARAAMEGTLSSIPTGSVSKLKAQLRQTKRLLARVSTLHFTRNQQETQTNNTVPSLQQDLTPDVRTTTERRLATLESELIMAQDSTLEKKMVVRYKGVRFFERQKCLRKIRQALKVDPPTPLSIRTLFEARADLYYVLHFPIKEKYIALFPEGQYVPFVEEGEELKGSERKRWQVRKGFRALLESGEVDEEVEKGVLGIQGEHDHEEEGNVNNNGKRAREGEEEEEAEEEEKEEGKKKSRKMVAEAPNEFKKKKPSPTKSNKKEPPALASAPKPVSTSTKPTTTPTEADATQPLSKKDRKAEKDAKRKAAKEGTLTDKASTKEELEPKGWAGDDDFFA